MFHWKHEWGYEQIIYSETSTVHVELCTNHKCNKFRIQAWSGKDNTCSYTNWIKDSAVPRAIADTKEELLLKKSVFLDAWNRRREWEKLKDFATNIKCVVCLESGRKTPATKTAIFNSKGYTELTVHLCESCSEMKF